MGLIFSAYSVPPVSSTFDFSALSSVAGPLPLSKTDSHTTSSTKKWRPGSGLELLGAPLIALTAPSDHWSELELTHDLPLLTLVVTNTDGLSQLTSPPGMCKRMLN